MDADDSCNLSSTGDTLKSASQPASESAQLTWSGFPKKCPSALAYYEDEASLFKGRFD